MTAAARGLRPVVLVVVAVALALAAAGCSSAPSGAGAGDGPVLRAPLDASLSSAAATWVAVPMGHVHQLANTFWQLVVLPTGTSHWSVVTPPGFADNGGLVGAQAGSSFVTGFNPSAFIRFTPMSISSNLGAAWGQGVLNGPLATVPDALAASGTGPVAALTGTTVNAVGSASAGLSAWTPVVTLKALASTAAGRACGITALTALAYSPTGQLLVGATCTRAGEVGVFEESAHTWRLDGPGLPAGEVKATTTVLRLRNTADGVSALVAARSAARTVLLGASTGNTTWSPPAVLIIGPAGQLTSSAVGANGALDVVVNEHGHAIVNVLDAGSARWDTLRGPPAQTDVVALEPSGALDALSVSGSRLSVFRLDQAESSWQLAQTLNVPIEYGSSS